MVFDILVYKIQKYVSSDATTYSESGKFFLTNINKCYSSCQLFIKKVR